VVQIDRNPAVQSLIAAGKPLVQVADSFQNVLGRTFVFDPGTGQYVPDDARTGAPADGVRFILYTVHGSTYSEDGYSDLEVRLPLREVGFAEVAGVSGAPGALGSGHAGAARAATTSVRAVIDGTTSLEYTTTGAITDGAMSDIWRPISVLAGPRQLSAAGTVAVGAGTIEFTYSDWVDAANSPEGYADGIQDSREYRAARQGLGEARVDGFVGSSIRFADSDRSASLRVAFPSGNGGSGDSTVVDVGISGIRGFVEIILLAIDGDLTALTWGTCHMADGGYYTGCFRHGADSVVSGELERFRNAVATAGGALCIPAYWRRPGPIEALLAPALFAVRRAVAHPA
jgi:hypothetical protein